MKGVLIVITLVGVVCGLIYGGLLFRHVLSGIPSQYPYPSDKWLIGVIPAIFSFLFLLEGWFPKRPTHLPKTWAKPRG